MGFRSWIVLATSFQIALGLSVSLGDGSDCPNACNNHGYCHQGTCQCFPGFAGETCRYPALCPNDCSLQGVCEGHECKCYPGFMGLDCSIPACPNDCSGHGLCNAGVCLCENGWAGQDCSFRACPNQCSGNGLCLVNGQCACKPGYEGDSCELKVCMRNCSFHGTCNNGLCECFVGWAGEICNLQDCIPGCMHGKCLNGTCCCDDGFVGSSCQTRRCPLDCSHQGFCDDGVCRCAEGFFEPDCRPSNCPRHCSGHGTCDESTGVCHCERGWTGLDCLAKKCPHDCHGLGLCSNGTCVCDHGRGGIACDELTCPNDCSGHGVCNKTTGMCTCDMIAKGYYYQLPDCASKPCLYNCNFQGRCLRSGACVCYGGWKGVGCENKVCPGQPDECSAHGSCVDGECECEVGWMGEDCSKPSCEFNCSSAGVCVDGTCFCQKGHYGSFCQHKYCLNDCHSNQLHPGGVCNTTSGICQCHEGFLDDDCGRSQCPNQCSHKGVCDDVTGICTCISAYTGPDCSMPNNCSVDCSNHGLCINGSCVCDPEYRGWDCSILVCPGLCNSHGTCTEKPFEMPHCECESGWTGAGCDLPVCGIQCPRPEVDACVDSSFAASLIQIRQRGCCSENGYCQQQKCFCDDGWTGLSCETPVCPRDEYGLECGGETKGRCVTSLNPPPFGSAKCACFDSFDGIACQTKTCRENCNGNGICFNGTCACFDGYEGELCDRRISNKTCACNDRCHTICAHSCNRSFKAKQDTNSTALGMCYLGCREMCVERCVKGNYEPTENAGYCDSEICRWARNTKGLVEGEYDSHTQDAQYESDARMPPYLQATNSPYNRDKNNVLHHDKTKHDSFGFFTSPANGNYFVGDSENQDNIRPTRSLEDEGGSADLSGLVVQSEPKLDLSQMAAGLNLSPEDIESIMTGKK